jgi:hypothetical protein
MMKRAAYLAAVGVLLGSAAFAADPKVEFSASAGYTFSDGVSGDTVVAADGNAYNTIEPKDSFSFGFTLEFFVSPNLEVGFLYDNQKSTLQVGGTATRDIGDVAIRNYHGIFTYNFGDASSKTRFYFMGGLGATSYGSVDYLNIAGQAKTIDGPTKFSTTWAVGLKAYPSPKVGLRLQARWTPTYIKSDATGWWCDPYWGCYVTGNAQYSNQFELTGGLSFRF